MGTQSENERERLLQWLAEHGQRIADGMFRDAGLFYDDECETEVKSQPEADGTDGHRGP